MVSQELVEELNNIIKEEYGKDLDIQATTKIANDLVGYFDLLTKIYHQNNNNEPTKSN